MTRLKVFPLSVCHQREWIPPERFGLLATNLAEFKSSVSSCKFENHVPYSLGLDVELDLISNGTLGRFNSRTQSWCFAENACYAWTPYASRIRRTRNN